MRIGTLSNFIYLTEEADKHFQKISLLARELASGKKLDLYSKNPEHVSEALNIKFQLRKYEQYIDNIKFAKGYLLSADDLLGKIYDVALKAKEVLLKAANTKDNYDGAKSELTELKNRLLQLANTRIGDYYIFAGNNYTQKPFDGSTYAYNGGDGTFRIKVAEEDKVDIFWKGSDIFGDGDDSIFAVLDNAASNIEDLQTVEDSIGKVEGYLKQIETIRAQVGAMEQKIDGYQPTYENLLDNIRKRYAEITDVETDKTISEYQLANTTYKAILSVLGNETQRGGVLLKYF
jgi:flagellar hook-associated protein 3 FlgL